MVSFYQYEGIALALEGGEALQFISLPVGLIGSPMGTRSHAVLIDLVLWVAAAPAPSPPNRQRRASIFASTPSVHVLLALLQLHVVILLSSLLTAVQITVWGPSWGAENNVRSRIL